jgi:hypothetical protein
MIPTLESCNSSTLTIGLGAEWIVEACSWFINQQAVDSRLPLRWGLAALGRQPPAAFLWTRCVRPLATCANICNAIVCTIGCDERHEKRAVAVTDVRIDSARQVHVNGQR